jgi:hypothetical protein
LEVVSFWAKAHIAMLTASTASTVRFIQFFLM